MFNNYINSDDFVKLFEKLCYDKKFNILSKCSYNNKQKVIETWSNESSPPEWGSIPQVRERWNNMISGNKNIDFYSYITNKFFTEQSNLKALSLGCGAGGNEIAWAQTNRFGHIDSLDISPHQIKLANRLANQYGLSNILNFQVGDVNEINIDKNNYDAIFTMGSLHHFSPLEDILDKIDSLLKADGYFIIHEYVGPTKFQWTNRQLEVINGLLSIFPKNYRIKWGTGTIKKRIVRPSKLRMKVGDPSEAIESSNIIPLLHEKFEIVEIKPFGGTILHMLFKDIAQNFLSSDKQTERLLNLCFKVEDLLLESDDIKSDFVAAVCKKKNII